MNIKLTNHDLTIFGITICWSDYFEGFNNKENRKLKPLNQLVIFNNKFEFVLYQTIPELKIFDFWIINKFRYILYHSGKFHFKVYQ